MFHWTQENGEDQLTASQGLVVSPPMVRLAPNSQQLIRVIRTGAPPSGAGAVEDTYRLVINELPGDSKDKKGLQFLLRYSLPIFVEPMGTPSSPQPQLSWSFQRDGADAFLEVINSGTASAQIADVVFKDAPAGDKDGRSFPLAKGLLGYVLPHKTMRWKVKLPADLPPSMVGTWSAMINSVTQTPTLTITNAHR